MPTTKLSKPQIQIIKKAINAVVSKDSVLPILECVLIMENSLILTDLNTFVEIKNIGIAGRFAIEAKNLITVLELLPEFVALPPKDIGKLDVVFETVDGGERFKYEVENFENFPKTPTPVNPHAEGEINEDDKNRLINAANFASGDELRPAMMHVAFKSGYIAGTDAHMLYFEHSDLRPSADLLFSKTVIKLIDIFSKTENLALTRDNTLFILENSVVKITTKDCGEKYPDFTAILPKGFKTTLTVSKKPFIEVVKKATMMANDTTKAVSFDVKGKSLVVSASDIDYGREYENIFKGAKIKGDNLLMGFNGKFIQKAIQYLEEDDLVFTLNDANRPAVMNGKILIMPVMLSKYA